MGEEPALITQYIRKVRGGSQAILARASDGNLYITKLNSRVQGPNLLFNEWMGTELYYMAGLSVPSWRRLVVNDDFLERNRGCWFESARGAVRPHTGCCFGSRFLGEDNRPLFEILPGNSFRRVRNRTDFWLAWLLDVCAKHADNRQAIFRQENDGYLRAVFIDHGHMFRGLKGNLKRHFIASQYYLDPRIYPTVGSELIVNLQIRIAKLECDRLWTRAAALPDEWLTDSAASNFANCLEALSNSRTIESLIGVITGFRHPSYEVGEQQDRRGRRDWGPVLRPGIQSRRIECSLCA